MQHTVKGTRVNSRLAEGPHVIHIRWPTQFNLITQEFAARPEFYAKFGLPGHEGIDFQAPEGTESYAVADGVVSGVRPDGDSDPVGKPYGNQVRGLDNIVIYSIISNVSN